MTTMQTIIFSDWLRHRFELSRGDKSNVRVMEGMRGFAVFFVFLVHYCTLINPWLQEQSFTSAIAECLHTIGNAGVDLFFVLSGYLIYGSLINREQPFLRFMHRRVQRIYPTFLVVFGIYVTLSLAFPLENKIPGSLMKGSIYLLENLLLLPGLFPIEPLITVAWSLSYEMFYYLVIPLAVKSFCLRSLSLNQRITGFCVITFSGFFAYLMVGGPIRLVMFLAGIFLYEVSRISIIKAPRGSVTIGIVAGGLLLMPLPIHGSIGIAVKTAALFVAFFVFCHHCFTLPQSVITKALSWTSLRWLGNMSYSYYLIHGLTLKIFFKALSIVHYPGNQNTSFFWILLPIAFAITLPPSAILFLNIERRFSLKIKCAAINR